MYQKEGELVMKAGGLISSINSKKIKIILDETDEIVDDIDEEKYIRLFKLANDVSI